MISWFSISEVSYSLFELATAVFEITEQIEAGASGTQQHGIAFVGQMKGRMHCFLRRMSIDHRRYELLESLVYFLIIGAQTHNGLHFSCTNSRINS